MHEIISVHVGSRRADSSLFYYLTEPRYELTIHYRLWVVRSRSSTIVVDSGLPPEEALRRGITDARDVADALREVGVDATALKTAVLTHLHWDHASNAARFPRATFVAQKAELDWLTSPMLAERTIGPFYSDIEQFTKMADGGRFHLLSGDEQVVPGVEAVWVGGHTPGSQMVVVDTRDGKAIIGGDAIPTNRSYIERIPNGIHLDLREAIRVFDRTRAIAPVALFSGHDPEAMLTLA